MIYLQQQILYFLNIKRLGKGQGLGTSCSADYVTQGEQFFMISEAAANLYELLVPSLIFNRSPHYVSFCYNSFSFLLRQEEEAEHTAG